MIDLTYANLEKEIKDGVSVVYFWADWCGPCVHMKPELDAVESEYVDKVKFGRVNVDEQPETTSRYGVRSIPTILFFVDGRHREKQVGSVPREVLKNKLDKLLK